MRPATTENLLLDGPAGKIEVDVSDPGDSRRAIALIAHPHPLMGGTKDNKVVTTLARTFYALGFVALRPNFRGVGASTGIHDEGRGETADLIAVVRYAQEKYGQLPLTCAGFSFGSFVQTRVAKALKPDQLVLVAPAVLLAKMVGMAVLTFFGMISPWWYLILK